MYFTVYKSKDQWYWNLKSGNHQIIAVGGEGYSSKQNAVKGVELVKDNAADSEVNVEE